jgi:peroxiredoxin
VRSDTNLRGRFTAEGVDTRDYGSMPGVLDTNTRIEGRGRVLRSHSFSGRETNSVFINEAGRAFTDLSGVSGMDSIADGRGFAYLDANRDGWVDVALVNSNAPQLELFHNRMGTLGAPGRAIRVRLIGGNATGSPARGLAPRDGVGAHVLVEAGQLKLRRELRLGDGFAVQNSATMIIGIGANDSAESLKVVWPSGRVSDAGRVPAGSLATVREAPAEGQPPATLADLPPAVRSASNVPPLALDQWKLPLPDSAARLRVVTTMATWCPVCRGELPHLRDLRGALAEGDVALFGYPIDPNDSAEACARYVQTARPAYSIVADATTEQREQLKLTVTKHLGEAALPSTAVIDQHGSIIRIRKGVPSLSELRRLLRQVQ